MYNVGSKILAHLERVDDLVEGHYVTPISCEIDTSNYCQNNCTWCIYKKYLRGNRTHLDFGLYIRVIDQLEKMGCKSITFTGGGEPTMNPEFREMVKQAYYRGFEIGLITNGIKLGELQDILSMFKFVRVSVDAANREDYQKVKRCNAKTFDIVCQNIMNAARTKTTTIGISMVYEPGMKKQVPAFQALGKDLGVDYTQVKAVVDDTVEKTADEMKDMAGGLITPRFRRNSNLPCLIAGLIGQVTADGKYYYCCIFRGDRDFCIGDLRKQSIAEILHDRRIFQPDISKCTTCRYMNYAKEYEKARGQELSMLRHINFL
jgi:MoaA/NifB/PqqE/SkfB family radical SAM enzyme